jgi:small-conductance mechanosensitive channel
MFTDFFNSLVDLFDDQSDWIQWAIVAGCLGFTFVIKKAITHYFNKTDTKFKRHYKSAIDNYDGLRTYPCILVFCLVVALNTVPLFDLESRYIKVISYLVSAYCVYNLVNVFSRGHFVPKVLGLLIYITLALSLVGWLEPLKQAMSNAAISIGDIRLDLWRILSGIVILLVLLWLVGVISNLIEVGARRNRSLPPTMRVLVMKASRLFLYVVAILISLKTSGVDLSALAFFSGALGLGLGFGLQKVISNLVSGVIILLDKSIKPGDVIEIDGTYGWINTLRTRYVSVLTRDRKEILIPNEDFVTNKVVNWSFSDTFVRIKANVGISYDADVDQAIECCIRAAESIPRVVGNPVPKCLLVGFGDSSIDLQIRFWINDANEGVANVRSAVLLQVWREFKENNIEIPFPQREIRMKDVSGGGQVAFSGMVGDFDPNDPDDAAEATEIKEMIKASENTSETDKKK